MNWLKKLFDIKEMIENQQKEYDYKLKLLRDYNTKLEEHILGYIDTIEKLEETISEYEGALEEHTFVIGTYNGENDSFVFEVVGDTIYHQSVFLKNKQVAHFYDMRYWYIK